MTGEAGQQSVSTSSCRAVEERSLGLAVAKGGSLAAEDASEA